MPRSQSLKLSIITCLQVSLWWWLLFYFYHAFRWVNQLEDVQFYEKFIFYEKRALILGLFLFFFFSYTILDNF